MDMGETTGVKGNIHVHCYQAKSVCVLASGMLMEEALV